LQAKTAWVFSPLRKHILVSTSLISKWYATVWKLRPKKNDHLIGKHKQLKTGVFCYNAVGKERWGICITGG
jgi:hypothetical protein